MDTSPLEREILTHYWTTPGPYKGGSENWSELHASIVERFVAYGLLMQDADEAGNSRIEPNNEALRVYMDALAAVPFPVQRWVIPTGNE